MNPFNSFGDDFYINMNLCTEMELPNNRETILHYFERLQKKYPSMRNFYSRDKGDFVLEEEKEKGRYRWASVETNRLCSGEVNPGSVEEALQMHRLVLELAPYMLSVSPLDCEALDLVFAFDFTYRGNHNELVAEALGISPALEKFLDAPNARIINSEPSITLALDSDCRVQCRVNVETRTSAFQIRTSEYPEDQLSVYLTARQYGSLEPNRSYAETLDSLGEVCMNMTQNYLVDSVLAPLARAIATR